MSFTRPVETRRMRGTGVSASVSAVGRNCATLRVELYIAQQVGERLAHDRFEVSVGDGADVGSVLLRFDQKGRYKICQKSEGRRKYIRFPVPDCVPGGYIFASAKCQWRWAPKAEGRELIVELPLATWREAIETYTQKKE